MARYRDSTDKYWYKLNAANQTGRASRILPERYRRLFSNKQIVCIEYQDLPDSEEREIFQVSAYAPCSVISLLIQVQRVQLGMALTPAGGYIPWHAFVVPTHRLVREIAGGEYPDG